LEGSVSAEVIRWQWVRYLDEFLILPWWSISVEGRCASG